MCVLCGSSSTYWHVTREFLFSIQFQMNIFGIEIKFHHRTGTVMPSATMQYSQTTFNLNRGNFDFCILSDFIYRQGPRVCL